MAPNLYTGNSYPANARLAVAVSFVLANTPMNRTLLLVTAGLVAFCSPARALDLHADRSSPFDLAVTGKVSGIPAGETRYVRWKDLRALQTDTLVLNGEFTAGDQKLTVVYLDVVRRALPVLHEADVVFATCTDGYAAIYTDAFVSTYRPFLVLEIDGKGPSAWPPPGLDYNPGPYVITVSSTLVPEAKSVRDIEHKKPWGVTSLDYEVFAERERGAFSGPRAHLSATAQDGRDIWINSCASCHGGPDGMFGGTRAGGRPFQALAAYAAYDRPFFVQYVRKPKSIMPCAQMEPHPDYSDEEFSHLIEFMTADLH
jgi:Cytochrome C oxidase, cbb3-type, subunit III